MVEKLEKPKRRMLLVLDEAPTLGRLEFLESALAFVRGYGIKALLITQSLSQLYKIYGQNSSIFENCQVRIASAPSKLETARELSGLLGEATVRKGSRSFFKGGRRDQEQEVGRPLLTIGEVCQLPLEDTLIFARGLPPYRAKKIFYYADDRFKGLDQIKPPTSAKERAAELPPPRSHDWLGPLPERPVTTPKKKAAKAAAPGGAIVLNVPQMQVVAQGTAAAGAKPGVRRAGAPAGADGDALLAQYGLAPASSDAAPYAAPSVQDARAVAAAGVDAE
jgi:type IV secretion system protein VirD4